MYATMKRLLVPAVLLVTLSACGHSKEEVASVLAAIAGGGAMGISQGTSTHYQPQYQAPVAYQTPGTPKLTNCQRQRNGNLVCTTH